MKARAGEDPRAEIAPGAGPSAETVRAGSHSDAATRSHRHCIWIAVFLVVHAGRALAAPGDPVQVKLAHCEPTPDLGNTGPGYAAPGYGNVPQDRTLTVRLAYHTVATGDPIGQALAATTRVELCYQDATGGPVCPGTAPWLLYDSSGPTGALPGAVDVADGDLDPSGTCAPITADKACNLASACYWTGAACAALTPLEEAKIKIGNAPDGVHIVRLPHAGAGIVDWNSSASLPWIFVKVNGQPATALAAAQQWGACAPPRHLADLPAVAPRFDVIGVDPVAQPLGPTFDVCTQGSRVRWWKRANDTYGSTPPGTDACITPQQGAAVGEILLGADKAQQSRLQAQLLAGGLEKHAWRNGARPGGYHPTHVFLGPHPGTGGQSSGGAFYMNVGAVQAMTFSPTATILNPDVVSLSVHEYMHQLQGTWGREAPASKLHVDKNEMLSESLAAAVELNLCAQDVALPGLPAACTSGWQLGQTNGRGIYSYARLFLAQPGLNLIHPEPLDALGKPKLAQYSIALFLLYAQEQFAHPLQTTAHPSGIASLVPRGAESTPLRDRASDEGVDFLGLLFKEASLAPAGWSTEAVLDSALSKALGRSLNELLLDLHTALFLKDYSDTDPRWRFTWTHKDARTQPVPLSTGKPFSVPNAPDGKTCGCHGGSCQNVCDGLIRAKRELDSWARPCSDNANPACDIAPKLHPFGATVSGANLAVGPHGAALLSVFPDGGWYGHKLRVHVRANSGALPVFRIFRVDQLSGAFNLTPVPICGTPPLWECKATTNGGEYGFTVHVPILPKTREVLLLASGITAKGSFDWAFGPGVAVVNIADQPTPTLGAFIGDGSDPAKFVAKLKAWDANAPIHVGKPQLRLNIPGCPLPSCELAETDFSFLGLVGGDLQLLAALPPSFYPPGSTEGTLDLEISVAEGSPVLVPGALRYGAGPPVHATALALDIGTGMETGIKLDALLRVTRGLVQSLVAVSRSDPPDHFVSLISFADDADTLVPPSGVDAASLDTFFAALGGISPGGETSVGDGVLEAQSVLASAYDALAPLSRPHGQGVVVVADVANGASEPSSTYYQASTAPSEDGDGPPWYSGPLTRPAREAAGLPLPVVSTVGLGPDTDDGELEALARTGSGVHLQVASADTGPSLAHLTTVLADAMGSALASSAGYQRVLAVRSAGPADGAIVIPVEPGVRELRVWLVSSLASGAQATLSSPSGVPRSPSAISAASDSAAYRVRDPEAGDWVLSLATSGPEPHVFVEASVRGGVAIATAADTEFAAAPPPPPAAYDPGTWVGSDVRIRAALRGTAPLLDCDVSATLLDPAGIVHALALDDAAGPGDDTAGDGVYGALFTRTAFEGTHVASLRASCPAQDASAGGAVVREARVDFALRPAADADADLLPDSWELRHGLDPRDPGDADVDGDADGLTAWGELLLGSHPERDDSDGGGESDASEASQGRDPRDPRDDAARAPSLVPTPGNGVVHLNFGMHTDGLALVLERAPDPGGPFEPVPVLPDPEQTWGLDTGAANGETACYRARAEGPVAISAWSTPRCVTPAQDPVAPVLELSGPPTRSSLGAVVIPLRLEEPESHGGPRPDVDLGTTRTPGAELRWWRAGEPETAGVWEGFSEQLSLTLPEAIDVVHVQARDGAGNSSDVLTLTVGRLEPPCGDLDDDGRLTPADANLLRQYLAAPEEAALGEGALDRCAVIGAAADCDLRTAVVLRRQVEAFGLDPPLAPVCSAALAP